MTSKIKGYCTAVLIILMVWYLLAAYLAKPFFPLPYPVLKGFFLVSSQGQLAGDFIASTCRVLTSLFISTILAVPLGLFLGRNPSLDQIISPIIYLLYPLPKIAFLPLIVVLLGLGNLPKILLISLIVFFQIIVTARDAAKDIPRQWILSMKSLHASRWQMYRHLVWPFCLPRIFTSLRVSLGTAIAVLFLAETFASTDGLGFYILDAMEKREFIRMYAGILAMGLLGAICYLLIDLLDNLFCRWNKL